MWFSLAVETATCSGNHNFDGVSASDKKEDETITLPQSDALPQPPSSFSIRGDGRVHKVAGAIACDLRLGKAVLAQATGTMPVNITVKALCIGRQYVQGDPGFDLGFRVNHQKNANKDRISQLSFAVDSKVNIYEPMAPVELLRVTAQTRGRAIGAQIASTIQNNRIPTVRAVGPRSVGNMIVGATWARRFLRRKGIDAICYPEFKLICVEDVGDRTSIEATFNPIPYVNIPYIDFSDEDEENENEIEAYSLGM